MKSAADTYKKTGRPFRVGVFGHYGNENLGDESIVEATIANIRRKRPDTEIVCFSLNPPDTEMRYEVRAFPVILADEYTSRREEMSEEKCTADTRMAATDPNSEQERVSLRSVVKRIPIVYPLLKWLVNIPNYLSEIWQELKFLGRSRAHLNGLDLLIFAGSNQFLDNFGGVWGFPYNVLKWTILARLMKLKVAFVSVGAGPLFARTSRAMVRVAVALAHYVSYRDESSKQMIEGNKDRGGLVYPDLAFSLPVDIENGVLRDKPVIGINAMAVFHSKYWFIKDAEKYSQYVRDLAELALFVREEGNPFFFYANQPRDESVIEDVLDVLESTGLERHWLEEQVRHSATLGEYMRNLMDADVIVATRFHGTVLGLLAERPVLGLCYYWKAARLLEDMELGRYALDLDSMNIDQIKSRLTELISKRDEIVPQIRDKNRSYLSRLDEQYDKVLSLLH